MENKKRKSRIINKNARCSIPLAISVHSDYNNSNNKQQIIKLLCFNIYTDKQKKLIDRQDYGGYIDFSELEQLIQNGFYIDICGNDYEKVKTYMTLTSIIEEMNEYYVIMYNVKDLDEAIKIIDILYKYNKIGIDQQTEMKLTNDFNDLYVWG